MIAKSLGVDCIGKWNPEKYALDAGWSFSCILDGAEKGVRREDDNSYAAGCEQGEAWLRTQTSTNFPPPGSPAAMRPPMHRHRPCYSRNPYEREHVTPRI
jgi:hypothetical protein